MHYSEICINLPPYSLDTSAYDNNNIWGLNIYTNYSDNIV